MKTTKLFTLTSLLLALVACGSPDRQLASSYDQASNDSGIIGGQDVADSDTLMKSTVGLILLMGDSQAICTGSLVSENVVLTAAHCVVGIDGAVVVYGADLEKAAKDKKYLKVTNVFVHPSYSEAAKKDSHDIALVRFEGKLPDSYAPTALLSDTSLLSKGLQVTLAGYGASSEENGDLSGSAVLRKTTVPLANPQFSKTEMSFSSSSGSGACHGDSGGPAFATVKGQTVLVGVTSRTTDPKGGCHKDSIYTNVAPYKDMIEKMAAKLQASSPKN